MSLLSGVSSGVVTTVLLQPLDVAKTSLINPAVAHRSMTALFRSIAREEGVSRLWRGLEPALLRITLGSGCYFTAQSALVSAIRQRHSQGNQSLHRIPAQPVGCVSTCVLTGISPLLLVCVDCSGEKLSPSEVMSVGAVSRSVRDTNVTVVSDRLR